MIIRIFWLISLLISSAFVKADSEPVRLTSFQYHASLKLNGAGPFFEIAIPLALYQSIQQSDLSDIRLFNAQGETVPYAFSYPPLQDVSSTEFVPVPFFPIHVSSASAKDIHPAQLSILRHAQGMLIAVQPGSVPADQKKVIQGVVIDVSQLEGEVQALQLSLSQTEFPFHNFKLESSDNLEQWTLLKQDGQFVRLEHNGQHIEKNHVEWEERTGKYLRLLWQQPEQAPVINGISVKLRHTSIHPRAIVWSDPIKASQVKNNIYDYQIPGNMPVEKLDIQLPQSNTLTSLVIQKYSEETYSRHRRKGFWLDIAESVVFRLKFPQGEVLSSDIVLNQPVIHHLRLVDTHHTLINTQPIIRIGFTPNHLVFLARGKEPFTLAWGASGIGNAALSLDTLLPRYGSGKLPEISTAKVLPFKTGPALAHPLQAFSTHYSQRVTRWILWGVLVVGVLILLGMAWRLLKQLKN